MLKKPSPLVLATTLLTVSVPIPVLAAPAAEDTLVFGDAASEKTHNFEGEDTKSVVGALGETARVSLPRSPVDYYGGDLTFDLKVNPVSQNYLTVKFWGNDLNGGQKALLYINGEQLGYRHMGDYEALNHGATETSFKDRFFYYTDILPLSVTRGRQKLTLTLKTIGPISGYSLGGGYDGYQGKMAATSRGYYRVYTHTNPALWGQENEKQGAAPPPPPVRPAQDLKGDLATERRNTNSYLSDRMGEKGRMQPKDINGLASGLAQDWTNVGKSPESRQAAITQLIAKIDDQAQRLNEPDIFAKGSYQSDWGGHYAPIGEAIFRMNKFISPSEWKAVLDESIALNGEKLTRREVWTRMLKGNFDYARTHVARITNQAEICMEGAYRSNKGLQIINPVVAEPEETAKRFLFEALGIWPYRGNDILDANGKMVGREDPFGQHYMQVTDKGLTREYTYVAIYGEASNVLVDWWELYGYDELLKKALIASNARAHMKYADFDDDGFRAMRMEGVIESRGPAYPDSVGYGTRLNNGHGLIFARIKRLMEKNPTRYSGPEWAPYWKLATNAVGYAQQWFRDNTFSGTLDEDYEYVKNHPQVGAVLPMTYLKWYSPAEIEALKKAGLNEADYTRQAWTDEDDGIVVLRDGDLTMFVSLIQKAGNGINGVARIHCITPTYDRLGAAVPDVQFDWNGQYSVRPDWTNVQFTGANNAPEAPFQVLEGEILPVAVQPEVDNKNPQDSPYSGFANFYSLRYGDYLIGQNTTRAAYGNARPYDLKLPAGFKAQKAFDFVSGKEITVKNGAISVGPQSTVVIKLQGVSDLRPPMASRLVAPMNGADGVTVRWIHAGGAEKYLIKRASSKTGPFVTVGQTEGENSYLDKGGKPGDFYTIAGQNGNGVGLESPATGVLGNAPRNLVKWLDNIPADLSAATGAPRDIKGENIKQRVTLNWKVAKNGWSYDVLRAEGKARPILPVVTGLKSSQAESEAGPFLPVATGLKTSQFAEGGLAFGKTYFYQVVARNRAGVAGFSTPTIIFSPMDDSIPAPWKGVDVGSGGADGSDGLLNGIFSIRGSGDDVWANSDEFRYVFQALDGDGAITARVSSQQNTSEWTKSGLMIRESLEGNAKNAFVFVTPGHGLVFQTRDTAGGGTGSPGNANAGAPIWLKLTRAGNIFTARFSKDNKTWQDVGTANIPMGKSVLIGMAVNAHSKGAINLTQFDNVETKVAGN